MSIETNALSLHEILLSISDSLNKAQNQLRNMPPLDEYGRPNTLYQLPYLDFNLEVISQFTSPASDKASTTTSTTTTPVVTTPSSPTLESPKTIAQLPSTNLIRFTPFLATDYSKLNTNKVTSTISGRFVAIPPNEGLPQVYISCQAKQSATTPTQFDIVVKLQYATADPLAGQRVEVNFDQATSLGINGIELTAAPVFLGMKDGFTDGNGEFKTTVSVDNTDFYAGRTMIFVANSATVFSSVAISNI